MLGTERAPLQEHSSVLTANCLTDPLIFKNTFRAGAVTQRLNTCSASLRLIPSTVKTKPTFPTTGALGQEHRKGFLDPQLTKTICHILLPLVGFSQDRPMLSTAPCGLNVTFPCKAQAVSATFSHHRRTCEALKMTGQVKVKAAYCQPSQPRSSPWTPASGRQYPAHSSYLLVSTLVRTHNINI